MGKVQTEKRGKIQKEVEEPGEKKSMKNIFRRQLDSSSNKTDRKSMKKKIGKEKAEES